MNGSKRPFLLTNTATTNPVTNLKIADLCRLREAAGAPVRRGGVSACHPELGVAVRSCRVKRNAALDQFCYACLEPVLANDHRFSC
jgi:hypothetical protein